MQSFKKIQVVQIINYYNLEPVTPKDQKIELPAHPNYPKLEIPSTKREEKNVTPKDQNIELPAHPKIPIPLEFPSTKREEKKLSLMELVSTEVRGKEKSAMQLVSREITHSDILLPLNNLSIKSQSEIIPKEIQVSKIVANSSIQDKSNYKKRREKEDLREETPKKKKKM